MFPWGQPQLAPTKSPMITYQAGARQTVQDLAQKTTVKPVEKMCLINNQQCSVTYVMSLPMYIAMTT